MEETLLQTYKLNELTNSRILYDKKPPRFMVYTVSLILALLIIFIVWSMKSVKTYVIKGQGLVTTEKKSNIMAKVSGEISDVFVQEGFEVKEGDVLITLTPIDSKLQLDQIKIQINLITKRISLFSRAEKDASNIENNFDKNNLEEAEFYNKLSSSYNKRKEFDIDEENLKKQNYTEDQIAQYKKTSKDKLDVLYYDTIIQFTNEKKQLEFEKSKLEAQKSTLEKACDEFKIIAPKSGKIHLSTPLNKGMVLQTGALIGTMTNNEENLIVETLISSSDRSRIDLNDEVSLSVAGLNQAEYGVIKGKVSSIDEDATIDNQKGNVFFKVKVSPEKTYLTDKKGEKVNLTLGMITETRVIYEKITYIKYFMEQIGIKIN